MVKKKILKAPCGRKYQKQAFLEKHIQGCEKCQRILARRRPKPDGKNLSSGTVKQLVETHPETERETPAEPDGKNQVQGPVSIPVAGEVDVQKLPVVDLKNLTVKDKAPYQDTFSEKRERLKRLISEPTAQEKGAEGVNVQTVPVVESEQAVSPTEAQETAKVLVGILDGVFTGMERYAEAKPLDKVKLGMSAQEKSMLTGAVSGYLETQKENPITPETALVFALGAVVVPRIPVILELRERNLKRRKMEEETPAEPDGKNQVQGPVSIPVAGEVSERLKREKDVLERYKEIGG